MKILLFVIVAVLIGVQLFYLSTVDIRDLSASKQPIEQARLEQLTDESDPETVISDESASASPYKDDPEASAVEASAAVENQASLDFSSSTQKFTPTTEGEMSDELFEQSKAEQIAVESLVRIYDSNQDLVGSGVVTSIDEQSFEVVSAFHVLSEQNDLQIEFFHLSATKTIEPYRSGAPVELIRSDEATDLIQFRVPSIILPVRSAAVGKLDSPESLLTEGWVIDGTGPSKPKPIWVTDIQQEKAKRSEASSVVEYWRIAMASKPGMSGSGLFSEDGILVGIASGVSGQDGYYCARRPLIEFLSGPPVDDPS